ncbi:MAG: hypothetical protein V7L23_15210 [Nostoc sp.]|uniref:hypothetical protein n=1 Tax=Nostoc sp. TaxID=1180 RepID=UPI002FF1D501
MPILTPEELLNYLPLLSLEPIQAEGVIYRAQGIAESGYGANRNLEITQYIDERDLLRVGDFRLPNFPLLSDPAPSIQIRDFGLVGYGGLIPQVSQWIDLESDSYNVDYEVGEIRFLNTGLINNINVYTTGISLGVRRPRNYPMHKYPPPKLRITYTAGYDFSPNSTSPDVKKMKSALAAMIEVLVTKGAQGIKSETSDQDKIEYFSASEQQDIKYLDYLAIFRKYAPRTNF